MALTVAFVAARLACLLGTVLGLLAGWYGGASTRVISRLVDIWMAFPPVLLSILLVAVIGTGLHSVIVAIVVIDWTRFCRVVRAETMTCTARAGRWPRPAGMAAPRRPAAASRRGARPARVAGDRRRAGAAGRRLVGPRSSVAGLTPPRASGSP